VRARETAADRQQQGDVIIGRPAEGWLPGARNQGGRGPHQVPRRPTVGRPREPHRTEPKGAGAHEQGAQGNRRKTPTGLHY